MDIKHLVDKAYESKSLKEIAAASPAALQGVSDKDAEHLKEAFNIKTIHELANHKFIRWAQAIDTLAQFEK
jgi:hypothetical protein